MGVGRKVVTAVVAVTIGAALHCGGKIDATLLPDCPTDGTCTSACRVTIKSECGSYFDECACSSGKLECTPSGGAPLDDCMPTDCAGTVDTGARCSTKGTRCVASVQTACYGNGIDRMCTCDGARFSCDPPPPDCAPPPNPPPQPDCPMPKFVKQGGLCTGLAQCAREPQRDCNGNLTKSWCVCAGGRWSCDEIGCAADAGAKD
jgi:hypothetical protein